MESLEINDIAIITVKGSDYCCDIYDVCKSDNMNLLNNFVLNDTRYI